MTPEQKKTFDTIRGFAHRTATIIAELPKERRAEALKTARRAVIESAAERGITDSKLLEFCADAVEVVLHEIENFGSPSGRNA